jgi:hypothetical protein
VEEAFTFETENVVVVTGVSPEVRSRVVVLTLRAVVGIGTDADECSIRVVTQPRVETRVYVTKVRVDGAISSIGVIVITWSAAEISGKRPQPQQSQDNENTHVT